MGQNRYVDEGEYAAIGWDERVKTINKFGKNADIDNGVEEDIISIGGTLDLTQLDGAVTTVSIVSSHANDDLGGAGAEKVMLYGLDENYELQEAEFILNGVGAVVTTGYNWRFIYRAKVTQSNNGDNDTYNVGTITFSKTGGNDIMQIDIGANQTLHCAYMIPAGYKGLIKFCYFAYESAPVADTATVKLWVKPFGLPWLLKEESLVTNSFARQRIYEIPKVAEEKSIIKLAAITGQNNTVWAGGFDVKIVQV